MIEVKMGRKDEPPMQLTPSEDLIAVRTRSRRSLRAGTVQPHVVSELKGSQVVMAVPEAGVEVYRVPSGGRSVEDRKAALVAAADVEFAGSVMVEPTSGEPVLYTENLFVKFADGVDRDGCEEVLRAEGLTIKQEITYAENAFFVQAARGTGRKIFEIAAGLLDRKDVEYCHPELVRRRALRAISDQQWHLKETTINNMRIQAHANVEAAHQVTQGQGVVIAVIDDGVDIDHPEFATPGKIVAPRDATFAISHPQALNPRPRQGDNHGTACAGVACANGADKASGVAPAAKLMPIRQMAPLMSQQEANAFLWAADNGADVISCSWGPPDGDWWDPADPNHHAKVPMPASTRLAIEYALANGRGGRGCVILFAAGNGNESVENDGYASSESVVAVAACNDRGRRSVYSDKGPSVWCAFPSGDSEWPGGNHPAPLTKGIWTTDHSGTPGYNSGSSAKGDLAGNYTNSFSGTSSACPGAAGVAALILSVNPALTWREVKQILAECCDRIDPGNGQYDPQTKRSELYGHGRLNAATAVRLATPRPARGVRISQTFHLPIHDLQRVEAPLDVPDASPVSKLRVDVDIRHTYIGDLVITLLPPAALGLGPVVLHNRAGGSRKDLSRTFDAQSTPGLLAFAGRACNGTWTLRVEDAATEDTGTLAGWALELQFA